MRWWQNAFSSSSSSSSSSSKRHSDNTHLHLHKFSKGLRSQRRLTRARRLRHLGDNDVGVADDAYLDRPGLRRSSSSTLDNLSPQSLSVGPQPLPLPELAMLLHRDDGASNSTSNSSSGNIPLPSPKEAPVKGREERERADGLVGDENGDGVTSSGGLGRSSYQDARKHMEHAETRSSRKVAQGLNGPGRIQYNYRLNAPISAPTSAFSSRLSPQGSTSDIFASHYVSPKVFQVWSAPEIPPLDTTLGQGFPYQMPSEKTAFSVDSSPLHSPRLQG
uniref:Putative mitogen-activated protein kinase kinase kinase YODA isoform X2 n=1 Tax=Davidia involucrata TaxID=16924 RepID=A0A5B7B7S1_DAVIN